MTLKFIFDKRTSVINVHPLLYPLTQIDNPF